MRATVLLRSCRVPIACALGVAMLASIAPFPGAAPVAMAVTATTTTIDVPSGTIYATPMYGGPVANVPVTAHVRPIPVLTGGYVPAVAFAVDGGSRIPAPLNQDGDAPFTLQLPPGPHSVVAFFGPIEDWGASESAPAAVTVGVGTTMELASSLNPALSTEAVTITATVTPAAGDPSGGTVTIVDAFDGSTIASGPVGGGTKTVTVTRLFEVGAHPLTATYSGDGDFGPSEATLRQVVNADTGVLVSSLGVQYATFYPVVDTYRDTVAIRGSLGEPATVRILVYSPTGRRVRTSSLGALANGAYSWAWDGRSSSGTLLAAGKYKIVQEITDTASNVRRATFYVNLSRKYLHWSTHTITLNGAQFGISGKAGTGAVSKAKSAYDRGVRISSGSEWAAVRYTFALRAATVYRPLAFKVLGRSPNGTGAWAGLWNRSYGSALNIDNYDARWVGPGYAWYSISLDSGSHRKGRTSYGEVVAINDGGTRVFDISKVRLTYRYGVLGS